MEIHHLYPDDCSDLYSHGYHQSEELFPFNAPVMLHTETKDILTVADGRGKLRPVQVPHKLPIKSRNPEQTFLLHYLQDPTVKVVLALGPAGTGKSLLSVASGLATNKKILYTRAFVSVGAGVGFLPGSLEEKMAPWMSALQDTCEVLGMQEIPQNDIECTPITFMRGRSLTDKFVIIDEAQNLTYHEIKTILTRIGEGCKVVLMGDVSQCDLRNPEDSGLKAVSEKLVDREIVASIVLSQVERGEIAALAVECL